MMASKISIVITTYNSASHIKKCLESVDKYTKTPHEIIVVDNSSSDETLQIIKSSKLKVKLLPQETNRGFSKANNIGVEKAEGEYLMFLNPDTYLTEPAIDKLLEFYESQENIGIVAPKLVMDNGSPQPSVRKLPTIFRAIKEYYLRMPNEYKAYVPTGSLPIEVESVVGAGVLILKETLNNVGGWDNRYFLYFEDLELCRQVLQTGLKIVYDPRAVIHHSIGASAKTNPQSVNFLNQGAKIYHGELFAFLLNWILRLRVIFN